MKKVKRQAAEWEKIFANHTSDKGLVCRLHRELLQISDKEMNESIINNKTMKDLNEHFSQDDIQMASKQAHEKVLSIISHQGNASENHKIPLQTHEDD